MGSGNETWRIVGARKAVDEETELEDFKSQQEKKKQAMETALQPLRLKMYQGAAEGESAGKQAKAGALLNTAIARARDRDGTAAADGGRPPARRTAPASRQRCPSAASARSAATRARPWPRTPARTSPRPSASCISA